MTIDPSIYIFINDQASYLNLWIALFLFYTIIRIYLKEKHPNVSITYGTVSSELAGLPLTLLHSVCFVKALISFDVFTALLFIWWGPGFIITAAWFIYINVRKIDFNWTPLGKITSWACKINYLLFMLLYWYFGCYEIMMAFSAWIIHDQINIAWFSKNADRTRRVTEDFWVIRVCYVGFLLLPIFIESFSYRGASIALGLSLFLMWLISIIRLIKKSDFYHIPDSKDFLRNIVYLKKK